MSRGRTTSHVSDIDENFDMADLENHLYAQIHYGYDGDDGDAAGPSHMPSEQPCVEPPPNPQRFVSSRCVVNNGSVATPRPAKSKNQRYWLDNDGIVETRPPRAKQGKRSSLDARFASTSDGIGTSGDKQVDNSSNSNSSNIPPGKRPKPFTPYTPLISESGIVATTSSTSAATNTNAGESSTTKQPEKESSKRKGKADKESRCVNPFNKLRERQRKRKEKIEAKKIRGEKSRQASIAVKTTTAIVSVADNTIASIGCESDDDDDDDDVVFIPSAPPPLVCIDSSGDDEIVETVAPVVETHHFTPPTKKKKKKKRQQQAPEVSSRGPSPTSSIVSDDFIGQNDRRRIDLEAFDEIADEELLSITVTNGVVDVQERVPAQLLDDRPSLALDTAVSSIHTDTTFATPSQRRNPFNNIKQSYVVAENSFAAVDVYESESSDVLDTVYGKGRGNQVRVRNASSSDSDDPVATDTGPKSKRLHKRKSSGSNKGSDHRTDLSTSDDDIDVNDDDDDSDDADDLSASQKVRNNLPYLVRGEALGKVKKADKRRITARRRTQSSKGDKTSDEEFLTKLTSICNEGREVDSDDDDDADDLESSHESIDARDIVQSVLQRRKKKLRVTASQTEGNEVPPVNDEWVVKDQIGETDDVTFLNVEQPPAFHVEDMEPPSPPRGMPSFPSTSTPRVSQKRRQSTTVPNDDADGSQCVLSNTSVVNEKIGWNTEMSCFYNDSWGGERFCTKEIQHNQPRNFNEWAIIPGDRDSGHQSWMRNRRGNATIKCLNCHERGHRMNTCPLPVRTRRCYMCGESGHEEPRCPNTKCLRCGKYARTFLNGCEACSRLKDMRCHQCNIRGHRIAECPDKWRRYHSTTTPNSAIVCPVEPLPIKPKYCSLCATRGHYAENCRNMARLAGPMPMSTIFIKSYDDVYKRAADAQSGPTDIEFRMHHEPKKYFAFNFGDDVVEDGDTFYGRFSRAVCLDQIRQKSMEQFEREKKMKRRKRRKELSAAVAESAAKIQKLEEHEDNNGDTFLTKSPGMSIDSTNANTEANATNAEVKPQTESAMASVVDANLSVALTDNVNNKTVEPIEKEQEQQEKVSDVPNGTTESNESTVADEASALPSTESNVVTEEQSDAAPTIAESDRRTPKRNKRRESDGERTRNQPAPRVRAKSVAEGRQSKWNELQFLNHESKRLDQMKEELILNVSPVRQSSTATSSNTPRNTGRETRFDAEHDTDSNYSFSDYYDSKLQQRLSSHESPESCGKSSSSLSEPAPDFISLESSSPSNLPFHTRSPTPPEIEEIPSVATILLTKEYTKFLLTAQGNNFLRTANQIHNVTVRMEWRSYSNVLVVRGTPTNQGTFHGELTDFCQGCEAKQKARSECIPKNRQHLIKLLCENMSQLDNKLISVTELRIRIKRFTDIRTKASQKQADRFRKELNMVLMGQAGLSDGKHHLSSLLQNLRDLKDATDDIVTPAFRREINEHFTYIFTPFDHGKYDDLIEQYKTLKRDNNLPILNLDRKLLGMKLNVRPDKEVASGSQAVQGDGEAVASRSPRTPSKKSADESDKLDEIRDVKNPTKPSIHWSKRSLELIEKVEAYPNVRANELYLQRLNKLAEKSERNAMTYNDYTLLVRYCDSIAKAADPTDKKTMDPILVAYNEDDGDDLDNIEEKDIKNPNKPSAYWSKKCLELTEKWQNDPAVLKNDAYKFRLSRITTKSEKNQMSYNDFRLFSRVGGGGDNCASANTSTNVSTDTAGKPQENIVVESDTNVSIATVNNTSELIESAQPAAPNGANDISAHIEKCKDPLPASSIDVTETASADPNDSEEIDEKNVKNIKAPSAHWSKKCMEMVDEWKDVPEIKSNGAIQNRLKRIIAKCNDKKISLHDYKVLARIFNSMSLKMK